MSEDDLIERCAGGARQSYVEGTRVGHLDYAELTPTRKDLWRNIARAVLSEASVPAPITAENIQAAEREWEDLPLTAAFEKYRLGRAQYVADYLNRARTGG